MSVLKKTNYTAIIMSRGALRLCFASSPDPAVDRSTEPGIYHSVARILWVGDIRCVHFGQETFLHVLSHLVIGNVAQNMDSECMLGCHKCVRTSWHTLKLAALNSLSNRDA